MDTEKTCGHCGRKVSQFGALFCPHCNKALIELPPPGPPPPAEARPPSWSEKTLEENRPTARLAAVIASLTIYVLIVTVALDPRDQAKAARVFGPEPMGMTSQHFVLLLVTILYLPFPWVAYQYVLIIMQAIRDGMSPLGLSALMFLFEVNQYHPALIRSKWICLGGACYFFATAAIWIVYAANTVK
jgi:hypothetical protein